jgi:hypothetical protein
MRYFAAPMLPVSVVVVDEGLGDGLDDVVALGEDAQALRIITATIASARGPMTLKPRR